jgi:hypothetical protein
MKKNKQKQPVGDLRDSKEDERKMQPEETTLDLPDVREIPGQEHVRPPEMKEFADVTISSDDEEGKGIFEDDEIEMDSDTNVGAVERDLLQKSSVGRDTNDEKQLRDAKLDTVDNEGDPLNERNDLAANDLDVPGSEEDDANEEIGEEDEENNSYSLGGEKDS